MPLTCNIDSRGKRARLVYGIILLVVGAALIFFWALPQQEILAWIFGGICLAMGGFAVFEARAGWCVMRAMGFKTRM